MTTETPQEGEVIEALALVELDEITPSEAANRIGVPVAQLPELLTPAIEGRIANRIAELKAEPWRIAAQSMKGLGAAAAALTGRLTNSRDIEQMASSEIVQVAGLLDKITAMSTSRAAEAKASTEVKTIDPMDAQTMCCMDKRPFLWGVAPPR